LSAILLLALFGWREATVVRPAAALGDDRQARIYAVDGIARMMLRAGDHLAALRALLKRSRLVLGGGPTTILAQGGGRTPPAPAESARVARIPGDSTEEKLVFAAADVAEKMRAQEGPAHTPQQGTA